MAPSWWRALRTRGARWWRGWSGRWPPLTAADLPPAQSDALRAHFAAHGVEIPALRTILVRADVEVCGFEVASRDATRVWERLRAATEATGCFPLLFHAAEGLRESAVQLHAEFAVRDTLRAAEGCDAAPSLAAQLARNGRWLEEAPRHFGDEPEALRPGPRELVIPELYTEHLFVLLLPTRDGCEFPAFLDWTDAARTWTGSELVAVLRSWRERFGAEPAAVVWDKALELVGSSLATPAAAREFARELVAYCPDTLAALGFADVAASLLDPEWTCYLWWD